MNHLSFKFLFIVLFLSSLALNAQIEYGGEPFAWEDKNPERFSLEFYATEALDRDLIDAQDAVTDPMKDVPYRFGWEWEVALNPANSGTWTDLDNGDRIWQLGIECPDASSISFIFDQYVLPKGAKLYIWNHNRTIYKGAFTHLNNKEWGSLGVGLIHSDRVIIELHEPSGSAGMTELQIGTIVHGYRDIVRPTEQADFDRGPFGNSGACNINVNCPIASEWQVEKRSVALIINGGSAQCTGALVNNVLQDGTPYFLTANHCLGGQNNWVFYFNHESGQCNGSNGPTNQSISGSTLRASRAASDFALLELSSIPPANYNAQYSGWDNSDATNVISTVGIHHPSGDVKKICFDDDAPYHQNVFGAACWYIDQWEDGVTEGGSSGSPLFDQNHRIIGQLFGGAAACSGSVNNGQADWYGRFGVSWDGNSANQRLRDWLDPNNTGVTILDGWPEGFVAAEFDVSAGSINSVSTTVCENLIYPTFALTNQGSVTLTSVEIEVSLNGGVVSSTTWTGSLAQNMSESINLQPVTVTNGNNTLTVTLSEPNGQSDENPMNNVSEFDFFAITGSTTEFELNLILDDYGSETTWEITNESNQVLFSGGPYQDDLDGTLVNELFCLPDGCYTFTIIDDWGDGICCEYGEGSWEIVSWNSISMGSGGEFDDVESLTFCTNEVSVDELKNDVQLKLYPNPAVQAVTLELPENAEQISIYNNIGQLVYNENTNGAARMVLPLSDLSQGRYQVMVTGKGYVRSEALVIQR